MKNTMHVLEIVFQITVALQAAILVVDDSRCAAETITTSSTPNKAINKLTTESILSSSKPLDAATMTTTLPTIFESGTNISASDFHGTDVERGEILGTAAAYKLDIREPLIGCSLYEFTCSNGRCIPNSKFCDRVNDCDDNSDEPRFCTRCNRTYYGDVGMTNVLELPRPKDERLPFVCELNFTAAGGTHGDIVQITIDGFSVGKFCSYVTEGCPDGFLQITEAARTNVGGMWCGTMNEGPVVFYSETRTVILVLKLLRPTKGGHAFDFRISYKVLPRDNAIVRFGGVQENINNETRGSSSYYNKNIFKDNEPNEADDSWMMTTQVMGPHNLKTYNSTVPGSRRNKERKKDRERDRDGMGREKVGDRSRDMDRNRDRDEMGRERVGDRNRDMDRSRDRDEMGRERIGDRNRDKDFEKIRDRDFERNRDRDGDRSRDRELERIRNRERGKDREKEREKDKEQFFPTRKNPLQNPLPNANYDDFDYVPLNNYNTKNNNDDNYHIDDNNFQNQYNVHYNKDYIDRTIEKNAERNNPKYPKGIIMNKPHGAWPFHSNKDINSYYSNRTEPKYYLGTLISGTHCSRLFSDCDKKACRLQSPNYPGIYPRNLTCYYAIRQHDVPVGKHALITVRQPKGDFIWINSPMPNKGENDKEKQPPQLVTWDDCDVVQDYITIYDGYTTRDPVILKFCGGGGNGLAVATSSGPELLIEFVTSPFGTFSSSPVHSKTLNGFHLEISVEFVDTQSYLYAKNKQMCEFWIRGTGHGELESPRHSLPPNTTCLYHLQGTESIYRPYDQFHSPRRTGIILPQLSRFKVWISVLKFNLFPKHSTLVNNMNEAHDAAAHENINNRNGVDPATVVIPSSRGGGSGYHYPNEECNGMLRIWDGPLREVPICNDLNCERDGKTMTKYGQNFTSVIARFCYNRIPKSCDHGVLNESLSRPCTVLESYVSSSDYVTLELRNMESTVLQPVNFKLRYEFVDYQQDGAPIYSEQECRRKFISSELERRDMGKFRSVRNIFLFGRGGSNNLNCVYRFESERDERIRITIKKVVTSNRPCLSRVDPDTKRSYCFGDERSKLEIMEQPTEGRAFYQRGCACNSSSTSDLPIVYTSSSRALEVRFTAINMTAHDDPDSLNFEATYEFIKLPLLCKEVKKLNATSGNINVADENKECRTRQWIIEPSEDRYLYVRMNGAYLRRHSPLKSHLFSESGAKSSYAHQCPTRARFVFTNGEGASITVCPASENSADNNFVELFSSGWDSYNDFKEIRHIRSISVEYIDPDDQNYQFTWFEMVPRVSLGLVAENCVFVCPELDACVNSSVWCDGINHCPSGYDESFIHCSALMKMPTEVLGPLFAVVLLMLCILSTYIYRKIKRSFRGSSILQTRLKSLSSMDTATFDDKDVIC